MTPDRVRQLLAEYASGSLSDADRKLLFEAALEEQNLFEELAAEHEIKDLLDQPGARARLIAALQPPRPIVISWWKRRWVWSAVGMVALAVSLATWGLMRTEKPVQVAQIEAPAPRVMSAPSPVPAPPPAAAPPQTSPKAPAEARVRKVAPAAPVLDREERAQTAVAPKQKKDETANQVIGGAVGGSAGAAPAAAPQSALRLAPAGVRFGFDYSIEGRTLVLKFASAGYVSIRISPEDEIVSGLLADAGSTRREAIPEGASAVTVVFTAQPQAVSGGVSLSSDARSGSITDPSRTRIELLLRLH